MKTIEMEFAISRRYDERLFLMVPNISWGLLNHEADMLVVNKRGYCTEFEIKRTFADFKNDFKKKKWQAGLSKSIKYFYYAFPAELWHKREGDIRALLPDFAGVMVVYRGESYDMPHTKEKKGPTANKGAIPLSKERMFKAAWLGTMRIWNLKAQVITLQNRK